MIARYSYIFEQSYVWRMAFTTSYILHELSYFLTNNWKLTLILLWEWCMSTSFIWNFNTSIDTKTKREVSRKEMYCKHNECIACIPPSTLSLVPCNPTENTIFDHFGANKFQWGWSPQHEINCPWNTIKWSNSNPTKVNEVNNSRLWVFSWF